MAKKKSTKKKSRSSHKRSSKKSSSRKKKTSEKDKYKTFDPRDQKELALDFAARLHKKFDAIIKATILFGSQTKQSASSKSDIDIVIIIDDASIDWDLELVAWYREELAKLTALTEYSEYLHINTIKLTTWWNDLMHGDPVILNILRYGQALIDIGGFFKPLKSLLLQGMIHSTPEAVHAALQRAPAHLARSKYSQLSAIEGVYWTMVDSAQAALITLGKLPPSPEHIYGMLKEHFVETGILKDDFAKWYRDIFSLHKEVSHGRRMEINGSVIDQWQDRGEKFMLEMTHIIDKLIEAGKK